MASSLLKLKSHSNNKLRCYYETGAVSILPIVLGLKRDNYLLKFITHLAYMF